MYAKNDLISIQTFQAAKLGEEIFIDAKTLKKGRTLAFLECEIKNAQGIHPDLIFNNNHDS